MPRKKKTDQLDPWRRSAAFREVARRSVKRINANRRKLPVCGAKTKKGTGACQMPAMENGRCRLHGGLTPKGDQWHRVQYRGGSGPNVMRRLERKLATHEKLKRKRAQRLARMSPAEREAFEKRARAMRPRTPAERARRQQDREARALFAEPVVRRKRCRGNQSKSVKKIGPPDPPRGGVFE